MFHESSICSSPLAESLLADAHFRSATLQHCIAKWQRRKAEHVEHGEQQMRLAATVHNNHLRYLFFRAWQWEYSTRQDHRALLEAARVQYLTTLKRKLFRTFIRNHMRGKANIQAALTLLTKVGHSVAQNFFSKWRLYLLRRLRARRLAVQNLKRRMVVDFRQWWVWSWRTARRTFFVQLASHLFQWQICGAFLRWEAAVACKILQRNNNQRNCAAKLEIRLFRIIQRKSWHAWYSYHKYCATQNNWKFWILSNVMQHWKGGASFKRLERLRQYQAKQFALRQLVHKWRFNLAQKVAHTTDMVEADRRHRRSVISSSWCQWKKVHTHRVCYRKAAEYVQTLRGNFLVRSLVFQVLGTDSVTARLPVPLYPSTAHTPPQPFQRSSFYREDADSAVDTVDVIKARMKEFEELSSTAAQDRTAIVELRAQLGTTHTETRRGEIQQQIDYHRMRAERRQQLRALLAAFSSTS